MYVKITVKVCENNQEIALKANQVPWLMYMKTSFLIGISKCLCHVATSSSLLIAKVGGAGNRL